MPSQIVYYTFSKKIKERLSSFLITNLSLLSLPPRLRAEHITNTLRASKDQPREEEDSHEIEHAKGPNDAVVEPLVTVEDVEASQELVTVGVLAEFAQPIATILHVSAGLGDESLSVRLASLARWGCEASEFGG